MTCPADPIPPEAAEAAVAEVAVVAVEQTILSHGSSEVVATELAPPRADVAVAAADSVEVAEWETSPLPQSADEALV